MPIMKNSNEIKELQIQLEKFQHEIKKLVTEKKSLNALLAITRSLAGELDLENLLFKIINQVKKALSADRCTVFLLDETKNELWSKVALGIEDEIRFPADKGIAGYALKKGEIVNIPDAYQDHRFNPEIDKKTGYKTRTILTLPMFNKQHEVFGVFQALNKKEGVFTTADEKLLTAISMIASSAIENAQLYEEQKISFLSFIDTLSTTLDTRDYITAGHARRVTLYAQEIGRLMKLHPDRMEVLRYAALLHDIGKIGVPEMILFKDRKLSNEEYEIVKRHAKITKNILKKIHFSKKLKDVPEIAGSHHERLDGTGYPEQRTGEQIPLEGKILALADTFDAITSRRQFLDRMDLEKVLQIIDSETGTSFEPYVVYNFKYITLDRLIQILEFGHTSEMNPDDIKKLCDYTLRELVEIRAKADKSDDELEIENIFMRYYLRQYRTK
jgi:HD-GYP domain-containing protein (c-di-GMP phosphodiesterase class II)